MRTWPEPYWESNRNNWKGFNIWERRRMLLMTSKVNWTFQMWLLYSVCWFTIFCSGLISRQAQSLGIHSSPTSKPAFQIPLFDQESSGFFAAPQELQKPLMTLKEAMLSKEASKKGILTILYTKHKARDTEHTAWIRSIAVCNQLSSHSNLQKVWILDGYAI